MGAIVERLTRTPNPEPVPVVRLYVVFIWLTRSRPLPQIPVQLRRHRRLFPRPNRLPHVAVPGLGEVGPANEAVVNLVDNFDGVRRRALLSSHLHELLILLLSLHQHRSLSRVVAAGPLDIDMFARLQTGNGHRRVPVIRGGNRDGVDILLLKEVAKVLVGRRRFAHLFLGRRWEFFENIAVHIADIGDSGGILVRLERSKSHMATPIEPNPRKVETIMRAEDLPVALCRRSNSQTSRSY